MSNSQIWQYFCKQTRKLVFPVHKYIAHTTIRVIYSQTFLNDPWKTWLGRRGTHIMFKFEPDIKNHIHARTAEDIDFQFHNKKQ